MIKARLAIVRYEDVLVSTDSYGEAHRVLRTRDYGEEELAQVVSLEHTDDLHESTQDGHRHTFSVSVPGVWTCWGTDDAGKASTRA